MMRRQGHVMIIRRQLDKERVTRRDDKRTTMMRIMR